MERISRFEVVHTGCTLGLRLTRLYRFFSELLTRKNPIRACRIRNPMVTTVLVIEAARIYQGMAHARMITR